MSWEASIPNDLTQLISQFSPEIIPCRKEWYDQWYRTYILWTHNRWARDCLLESNPIYTSEKELDILAELEATSPCVLMFTSTDMYERTIYSTVIIGKRSLHATITPTNILGRWVKDPIVQFGDIINNLEPYSPKWHRYHSLLQAI